MKIRKDSPFANLTEDQRDQLLVSSQTIPLEQLAQSLSQWPEPIHCSVSGLSRFLKMLRQEKLLREATASTEIAQGFARREAIPSVREATLGAVRERIYQAAVDSSNRELLIKVLETLSGERSRDRLIELQERKLKLTEDCELRKLKVAEENVKIGWSKLEIHQERSARKLLPKLRNLALDTEKSIQDRLESVIQCLEVDAGTLLETDTH